MLYKYVSREVLKAAIAVTIFAVVGFGLIANLIFLNEMDNFKASSLRNVEIVQVEPHKYFVVGDGTFAEMLVKTETIEQAIPQDGGCSIIFSNRSPRLCMLTPAQLHAVIYE